VDTYEKRVENQVQFWSLIGPFLILLSVAILLFKMSAHWYFPLSALLGIPLCVKWKMKGMAVALACLLTLSIFAYRSVDLDQQYWHVGMALAMAFSLIILTLALEEVQSLMSRMQLESQSRLDNFLQLEESYKTHELEWGKEKDHLHSKIAALTQDHVKVSDEKQTFFKLAQLAKDELVQIHDQHLLLLEELIYKKQQISELQEKLEETELTIQDLVNSDSGQKIKHLSTQLDLLSNQVVEHDQEKERLHIAIVRAQDQCQNLNDLEARQKRLIQNQLQKLDELKSELTTLKLELEQAKKESVLSKEKVNAAHSICEQEKEGIQKLQSELISIKEELQRAKLVLQEKPNEQNPEAYQLHSSTDGNTRPFESRYIQLKKQFEEKSATLEGARHDLFVANEQLEQIRRRTSEQLFIVPEAEQHLQRDIAELCRELDDYQSDTEHLHEIISRLIK